MNLTRERYRILGKEVDFVTPLVTWGAMAIAYDGSDKHNLKLMADHHERDGESLAVINGSGGTVGYIPRIAIGKAAAFRLLSEGNPVAMHLVEEDRVEDDRVEDNPALIRQLQEWECLYRIDTITYIRPNYNKAGSNSWSPNWKGYLQLSGRYWDGSKIINFNGKEVSIIQNRRRLVAQERTNPPLQWAELCNLDKVGSKEFIDLCNYILTQVDLKKMVGKSLRCVRTLDKPIRWGRKK